MTNKESTSRRVTVRRGMRAAAVVLVVGTGVLVGTTGCGSLGYNGSTAFGDTVNWAWNDPALR